MNPICISKKVPYACSLSTQKKMQLRELRRIRSSVKMKNRQMNQSLLSDKLILQLKNYYLWSKFKIKIKILQNFLTLIWNCFASCLVLLIVNFTIFSLLVICVFKFTFFFQPSFPWFLFHTKIQTRFSMISFSQ